MQMDLLSFPAQGIFMKELGSNRDKVHTELTVDNSIFDTERYERLKTENEAG